MAKRSLTGSIDELPVFHPENAHDFSEVFELALITYKTTPHTRNRRQEMGGVLGRDSNCEHIYFSQKLFLQGDRRWAITGHHSGSNMEKIRISFLDDYEIIKAKD